MELDQFVKETIVCVIEGINSAKSEGRGAGYPDHGIEFDLGINIKDEKIEIVGKENKDYPVASRIKFVIPIDDTTEKGSDQLTTL